MCIEREQKRQCQRMENVRKKRRRKKQRPPHLLSLPDGKWGNEGTHPSQPNEIKRAKRIHVHQDWQHEDKVGHVGRRPVAHEPDVPVLALHMCVYRGERTTTVTPLWTPRRGTKTDVTCVVVVYERNEWYRDQDGTIEYPSWRELERGGLRPKMQRADERTHEIFLSRHIRRHDHPPRDEPSEKDSIRPKRTRQREPNRRQKPLRAHTGPHTPIRTVCEERLAIRREPQRSGAAW